MVDAVITVHSGFRIHTHLVKGLGIRLWMLHRKEGGAWGGVVSSYNKNLACVWYMGLEWKF